jgi:hypothetical protein
MSTNPETSGEEKPSGDAAFIIECLKNLNESKQVSQHEFFMFYLL